MKADFDFVRESFSWPETVAVYARNAMEDIRRAGLDLVEDAERADICAERDEVREKSVDNRFYAVRKQG